MLMKGAVEAFADGPPALGRPTPIGAVARGRQSVSAGDVAYHTADPLGKGWARPPESWIEASRHRCMITAPNIGLPRRTIHETPKALGLTAPEQHTFQQTY